MIFPFIFSPNFRAPLRGRHPKRRVTRSGRVRACKPIDKRRIDKLLNNRVYRGELRHKAQWYPGAHPPLIEEALWNLAQAILERHRQKKTGAPKIVCDRQTCMAHIFRKILICQHFSGQFF